MRSQTLAPLGAAAILSLAGQGFADQLTVPSTEYPTIGAAVAAAVAGDEILLLDGVFTGETNWNLLVTEPITIRSASGDPASVVWLGPEFIFDRPEDRALTISAEVAIEGITFRRFAGDVGGAILVDGGRALGGSLPLRGQLQRRRVRLPGPAGRGHRHARRRRGHPRQCLRGQRGRP